MARDSVEQVRRKIVNFVAGPTLRMEVRTEFASQVIGGAPVPDVHMLNHAELGQDLQGPVDTRAVRAPIKVGDRGEDVLCSHVPTACCQHSHHCPPWSSHPLASTTQESGHLLNHGTCKVVGRTEHRVDTRRDRRR
jgi:hypothetical protein